MRLSVSDLLTAEGNEALLMKSSSPYAFRQTDQVLWELYEQALSCFWQPKEIDPSKDKHQFQCLSPDEQHFIGRVLAFFATADGIVLSNIEMNFSTEVQCTEAKHFYAFQTFMECVHSETYMKVLQSYVCDEKEQQLSLIHI